MRASVQRQQRWNGFGLLAAQVAMAAARRRDGLPLDSGELGILEEAADLFGALASRIRTVAGEEHDDGRRPLVPVSIANEIVFRGEAGLSVEQMAGRYETLAAQLDELAQQRLGREAAAEMVTTYRGLAERARTSARWPALSFE